MDADITANIVDKTEKNANGKEAKRVQQLARELRTVEQFVHGLVVDFLWAVRCGARDHIPSVSEVISLGARKTDLPWLACHMVLNKCNIV